MDTKKRNRIILISAIVVTVIIIVIILVKRAKNKNKNQENSFSPIERPRAVSKDVSKTPKRNGIKGKTAIALPEDEGGKDKVYVMHQAKADRNKRKYSVNSGDKIGNIVDVVLQRDTNMMWYRIENSDGDYGFVREDVVKLQ